MTPKELELLQQHPAFTQHMLGILTELDQAATGDEAEAALQRGFQRVAVCALRETLTPKSESKPFKGVQRDKKKDNMVHPVRCG